MAKEKLITTTHLKKALKDFSESELITLLADVAQACPQAREFLTVKFPSGDNIGEVLDKYKQKVQHEFYPKRGMGRLNLKEAKKAISDFKRICDDKAMIIDLMLFYVENCIEFTNDFGDIDENFYNSACSVYGSVVKEINGGNMNLYGVFTDRLKEAARNACEGWGFQDAIMDLYYQIVWLEDDEGL